MNRANTFILEGCPALWELADSCAKLYNEVNFDGGRRIYATNVSSGILSTFTRNTLH